MRSGELTAEEKEILEKFRQEWFEIGVCTDPADRPAAEAAIAGIYALLGKKKPVFVWVDGPKAAIDYILSKSTLDVHRALSACFWGQHEAGWVAYYLFPNLHLGVEYKKEDKKQLELWASVARSCMWWWPFENVCIISERLQEVHIENGVLHRDGGPAILCRDGWVVYELHNVAVPEWLAVTKAEDIDPRRIKDLRNAEVRREFVRKVGIDRICSALDAQVIDVLRDYELLELDLDSGDGRRWRYLKMLSPSLPDVYHVEGVANESGTVRDSLAWRKPDWMRDIPVDNEKGEEWYQQGDVVIVPAGAKSLKEFPSILT